MNRVNRYLWRIASVLGLAAFGWVMAYLLLSAGWLWWRMMVGPLPAWAAPLDETLRGWLAPVSAALDRPPTAGDIWGATLVLVVVIVVVLLGKKGVADSES